MTTKRIEQRIKVKVVSEETGEETTICIHRWLDEHGRVVKETWPGGSGEEDDQIVIEEEYAPTSRHHPPGRSPASPSASAKAAKPGRRARK